MNGVAFSPPAVGPSARFELLGAREHRGKIGIELRRRRPAEQGTQVAHPPAVILVGACRLRDVYKLADGKMNTEWTRIFEHGGSLMVRIVGIGDDKNECVREAAMLMREHQPVCNLRGYTLRNVRRSIICLTNGRVYEGQQEAARDLGISQSAISRHLKGEQQHVAGFVFDYEHPNERIDRMKTTRRPLKDGESE